jgi:hypothetical protein
LAGGRRNGHRPEMLGMIRELIDELESRARDLENGAEDGC